MANYRDSRPEFECKEDTTTLEESKRAFSKAFTRPAEEEKSRIIKCQDDILKDPLSIRDNVKEEENSLIIKCEDDIPKDPLSIKDNVKEEEDDILKDPLSIKDEGKSTLSDVSFLY